MTIGCGMILFDESAGYSWPRLIGVWFCVGVICSGIFILAIKDNIKQKRESTLHSMIDFETSGADSLMNSDNNMSSDDKLIVKFLN